MDRKAFVPAGAKAHRDGSPNHGDVTALRAINGQVGCSLDAVASAGKGLSRDAAPAVISNRRVDFDCLVISAQ
jgi:hypothetical protein